MPKKKKIGHRVRLGENDLLFLGQAQSHRETAMLSMCARYERALMTQEIVRSEDAQWNTEESPNLVPRAHDRFGQQTPRVLTSGIIQNRMPNSGFRLVERMCAHAQKFTK